jgi:hypothetical protein
MPKPTAAPPREPPVRTFVEWTPSLVRSAEVLADGGNLRMAADLCEALLTDDRVQGVLGARVRGLLGLDLSFEASGDRRRSKRAVKALDLEEDWWASFPEAELARLLSWGILLGVGLGALRWTPRDDGTRVLPVLEGRHARYLSYDWTDRGWRLLVESGGEIPLQPGDGTWVLHAPYGAQRPWAHGAWRALARWWLLKTYARQDWARHSEVHGTPIRAGVAPVGSHKNDREELAADLAGLGHDTGLCLPPGYDLKLVEATARTWEMFREQIRMADAGTAIMLAGQNLTTEVSGGSLAAAQVHQAIRADLIRADGESTATDLHHQALRPWATLNFGDADLAPWPAWATDPPADLVALGAGYTALGEGITAMNAALAGTGQHVDAVALLTARGIPLRVGDPPAPPTPAPSPPAP